ncbi:MAG TPA: Crp/Fnr family transcriptional regulator [Rhodocyclaceae bacterium]|nr:Crp/Fnr family transcriptional regulator [Rhodocyclaceae bacterium]
MAAYLEQVELFAGLEPAQLDALAAAAQLRVFARGAIVVNEGDEGHGLFVVQHGALKVFLMDEGGRELTLSIHGPGEYFGELALLDEAPRSASVMALERCELLHIARPAFLAVVGASHECMQVLLRNLVRRIRTLTDNVHALALEDVYGRIRRLLDSLAVAEAGHWIVTPRPTQQEIANLVGASREMVNRILRDLVVGGHVAIEPHRIVIRRKLPARW